MPFTTWKIYQYKSYLNKSWWSLSNKQNKVFNNDVYCFKLNKLEKNNLFTQLQRLLKAMCGGLQTTWRTVCVLPMYFLHLMHVYGSSCPWVHSACFCCCCLQPTRLKTSSDILLTHTYTYIHMSICINTVVEEVLISFD